MRKGMYRWKDGQRPPQVLGYGPRARGRHHRGSATITAPRVGPLMAGGAVLLVRRPAERVGWRLPRGCLGLQSARSPTLLIERVCRLFVLTLAAHVGQTEGGRLKKRLREQPRSSYQTRPAFNLVVGGTNSEFRETIGTNSAQSEPCMSTPEYHIHNCCAGNARRQGWRPEACREATAGSYISNDLFPFEVEPSLAFQHLRKIRASD